MRIYMRTNLNEDRAEMMERAAEAGVEKFYMPNIDHRIH